MLFSNFYLPIEILKTTNKEYKLQEITYTEDELIQLLAEKLKTELLQEIKETNNIINVNINTNSENEYVEVEVTYEVLEKMGKEQEINI